MSVENKSHLQKRVSAVFEIGSQSQEQCAKLSQSRKKRVTKVKVVKIVCQKDTRRNAFIRVLIRREGHHTHTNVSC